jgi:hypothetical protein
MSSIPVKTVVFLAILNALYLPVLSAMQTLAPVQGDWTNSIERLTLSGALVVAVISLWRQLVKKDELLITSAKTMTEALAASAASNIELRRIIDESVLVKQQLTTAIDLLRVGISKLPCTAVFGGSKD